MRHIVMLAFVVMFSHAGVGQVSFPEKWSGRVSVEVQADVEQLRNDITSYVDRELRSLGDVSVTDSEPTYVLEIIAAKVHNTGGAPLGTSISVLITRPLVGRSYFDMWLKDKVASETIDALANYYAGAVEVVGHSTWYGADLQVQCRNIVTGFDTRVLVPARKVYKDWIEQQKRQRKK